MAAASDQLAAPGARLRPSRDIGRPGELRADFSEILRLVRPGSRVLDVGCGEGALLELLAGEKGCDGRGLEISTAGVAACLARGLAVVQGDADRDLAAYPSHAFDYAILSQTLQATVAPKEVLSELLRIADRAVVSFPNFGHWRMRLSLLTRGRMPETRALPHTWWSTPNIHMCTLLDFVTLCRELDLRVESCAAISAEKPPRAIDPDKPIENWRAESVLFLLTRKNGEKREQPHSPVLDGDLFGPSSRGTN
jgi:methionine biosynthesis protein MetW